MSVSATGTDAEDSAPHVQLDLFLKLGFSDAQVQAVVRKLGPRADTDRVLEELMQDGPPQLPGGPGPPEPTGPEQQLRPVVIDGSNVAMSHGNKEVFSCLGIELSVKFFQQRGHTDITVFVPSWRKEPPRADVPITDQQILRRLEKQRLLVFTPSRRVAGKRVVCYDDRFIVKLAYELDGVIVSNDTYRDLQGERPEWKRFIEKRLLMFSFVNDKFMPPDDPLGRHGPSLDSFLQKSPCAPKKLPCPYGRKCTYGLKCKFLHTERSRRSRRSLTNEPPDHAPGPDLPRLLHHQLSLDARVSENVLVLRGDAPQKKPPDSHERLDSGLGSYESPSADAWWSRGGRKCCLSGAHSCPPAPERGPAHRAERQRVREKLLAVFNAELVDRTMQMFPQLLDPQRLAAEILSGQSGASGPCW